MSFHAFPPKSWKDVLPLASEEARDLVTGLVVYQSTSRLTALDVSALPLCEEVIGKDFADSATGIGSESRLLLGQICKLIVRAKANGEWSADRAG